MTSRDMPFEKATKLKKRLKLFLWGETGVGKTVLSLKFPQPVVIDLEGGTDLYGDTFEFDVLKTSDPEKIMLSVDWLLVNKHKYKTLVIDPITVYWEALQKKWSDLFLKRKPKSVGYKHEFYDLQPKDWMTIKAEFKDFLRKVIALDMNVIVTARERTKYQEGSFMVAIGETFDGEKSLPYMFDTIVRMTVDKNKHIGFCIKDRSNKLPAGEFECTYETLEKLFGKIYLEKEATPRKIEDVKEATVVPVEIQKEIQAEVERLIGLCDMCETVKELELFWFTYKLNIDELAPLPTEPKSVITEFKIRARKSVIDWVSQRKKKLLAQEKTTGGEGEQPADTTDVQKNVSPNETTDENTDIPAEEGETTLFDD